MIFQKSQGDDYSTHLPLLSLLFQKRYSTNNVLVRVCAIHFANSKRKTTILTGNCLSAGPISKYGHVKS